MFILAAALFSVVADSLPVQACDRGELWLAVPLEEAAVQGRLALWVRCRAGGFMKLSTDL